MMTRIDADGVPMIVQRMEWLPHMQSFRVTLWNGIIWYLDFTEVLGYDGPRKKGITPAMWADATVNIDNQMNHFIARTMRATASWPYPTESVQLIAK